jgi:photosystem II CP47 chlorophyll apoprotein
MMSLFFAGIVFAGIDPYLDAQVEFGAFQKLGDPTTKKQAV